MASSARFYRIGYPLDDAWIHQTYARNLARDGEWAFLPEKPSAGSTAPMWVLLLTTGYLLHLPHYPWTVFLGGALLWGLSLLGEGTVRALLPSYRPRIPWIGLFLAGEWHLVWAAGSGMETSLYALLILLLLSLLAREKGNAIALGMLIGLSVWVRPDGVTLLGPAALTLTVRSETKRLRFRDLARLGIGFGALFAPYLLFNLILAGTPWPNTFYAKQVEYAALQEIPLWRRFLAEASLPLIGAGALLLPGFAGGLWKAAHRRRIGVLAGALWLFGYAGLYAWRLPVTYQHGRYLIPAMPVYFLIGLAGALGWMSGMSSPRRRVTRRAWALALAMAWAGFWLLGARAYARDVAVIESEMVATALWAAENLPPDALIAAHDIGALGYFGQHDLLDLAGLISPEVIPFLRDEARLARYLDEQGADYLIAFPSWYPDLTARAVPLHTSGGRFAPALGGENMTVYEWH